MAQHRWRTLLASLTASLLCAGVVAACEAPGAGGAGADRRSSGGAACTVTSQLDTWSLARLANQTVAIPVDADQAGSLAAAVSYGFGGVLLFGLDAPASLGSTLAHLRTLVPGHLGLFVMTDEEGGGVERMENLVGAFPWARTMAETMTPAQITALATRVGRRMLANGVDMDLAPVLDVDGRDVEPGATDPDGYRSFGGSPAVVATDGIAFMRGLEAAGVTPVVKHFPGLGGSTGNTDDGPAATLAWSELKRADLHPFESAITDGVPAIMVANARVPGLSSRPASLSPQVLVRTLRTWLGFKGLIVTDSLTAGAISAIGLTPAAAAAEAIGNGADMVLFGATPTAAGDVGLAESASDAIVAAVEHGQMAKATLVAAAAHVLAAKRADVCASVS